jgi:hypothetical protein
LEKRRLFRRIPLVEDLKDMAAARIFIALQYKLRQTSSKQQLQN